MFEKNYLTTGDLVKILGTTKNTLFHYDQLGLFRPAVVRENGYRAYSYWQIEQFLSIAYLRKIGMPLKEIQNYMENRNPERLEGLLQTQLEEVRDKIRDLTQIEHFLSDHLQHLHQLHGIRFDDISIQYQPEQPIYCSPELPAGNKKEGLFAVGQFCSETAVTLKCLGAVLDLSRIQQGVYDHPRCFFIASDEPVTGVGHMETKPAGDYLVAYHKGADLPESYRRLFDFAENNQWDIAPEGYEEYLLNELDVTDCSQYVTRISFRVSRRPK